MRRAVVIQLVVLLWVVGVPVAEALAEPGGVCPKPAGTDFCVEDTAETPDEPATPVVDAGGRGGTGHGGGVPVCAWKQSGVAGPAGQGDGGPFGEVVGTPSPGAEFYAEVCDGVYTGRVAWVPAGDPTTTTPVPAPEQLASVIRVRLEGSLPAPEVSSTPVAGVPAIVGYPSFVSVANWSGVVRDRECDPTGVLCVTVTATPAMRWSPGEPDAAAEECQGPGVAFDPEGAAPEVQAAAPGTCAYAYRSRTGVGGRPPQWPGVVTVEWALVWESSLGGGGSLLSVSKSAQVERAVNEVQTVVVSAGE